jgi:hypothetical protein
MPADDITVKKIPAMGVVALTAPAPAYGPQHIVPIVNRLREQFDLLAIPALAKATGPYMIFYDDRDGTDITVHLALPVARPPAGLPPPAKYLVLPEIEAVTAVRNGAATSIFPMVYYDLARWAGAHRYQARGPGREVWVHEVDDIAEVGQQVIEVQLPFTRPDTSPPRVSRGRAGPR